MTREIVQIVQIDQPFCDHDFGQAPCTATALAGRECFNTRSTCQDSENFSKGVLTLTFAKGDLAANTVPDLGRVIPSLISVSTQPAHINLSGASPDAQGLGLRAVCSIVFKEHPHSDRAVDKYRTTRGYDPMQQPGGFWAKWIKRNRYRKNVQIRVYEGYAGQRLDEMTMRRYFLENVTGPDQSGAVSVTGMDILARAEERKAVAPILSVGELYEDIDDVQLTATIAGAPIADYPAPGTIRIDNELIRYSTVVETNGRLDLTITQRASDGSTAASHTAETRVQWCERIDQQTVDDITEMFMTKYVNVDVSWLDLANWQTEVQTYLSTYRLSKVLSVPKPVIEHLNDLQVQVQFFLWWDERVSLVKLKAIRGIEAQLETFNEADHIVKDSVSIKYKPRERVSQVWIYYGLRDQSESGRDSEDFALGYIIADLPSEGDDQYGEKSIREIRSLWLQSAAQAAATATRISRRFRDTPREIVFELDKKDGDLWNGDGLYLLHRSDVDDFGGYQVSAWTIVSSNEFMPGERVRYVAEDTTQYGTVHYIMPDGTPAYPGAENAPFRNCYIGDADGLLSDGSDCGRIS